VAPLKYVVYYNEQIMIITSNKGAAERTANDINMQNGEEHEK
jgi:hypothetical protein|tara:strand:+ start:765 stop:890 length:126 start_codon:yes stop_codon:yes gene_type:complete